MSQVNIIANKVTMTDANYNQGEGISATYYVMTPSGSKIMTFINGFYCDALPINQPQVESLIFDFINGPQGWGINQDYTSGCATGFWFGAEGGYLGAYAYASGGTIEWDYYPTQPHVITIDTLIEIDMYFINVNIRDTVSASFPSVDYGKTIDYIRFIANSDTGYLGDVAVFFTDLSHKSFSNATGSSHQDWEENLYYLRITGTS